MRALGLATALLVACDGPSPTPTDEGVTFTEVRDAVLVPNCALSGCHDAGSVNGMALIPGEEWAALVDAPSVGAPGRTLVVPADSEGSYVVWKLRGDDGIVGDPMPPPFGQLDPTRLQLLVDWIDAGALDN